MFYLEKQKHWVVCVREMHKKKKKLQNYEFKMKATNILSYLSKERWKKELKLKISIYINV